MFKDAPRPFVALLGIVVAARVGLALLSPASTTLALVQAGFVAFMAWRALEGKRSAAAILGGLFTLGAAFTLYQALSQAAALSAGALVILVSWALLLMGTAAYIFFHPVVRKFYVATANPPFAVMR